MALTIRQRAGERWVTETLHPATLTRNVWGTQIHGKTGQPVADGWLEAGETVHVRTPKHHKASDHRFWEQGDPEPADEIFTSDGMLWRISCSDRRALVFGEQS